MSLKFPPALRITEAGWAIAAVTHTQKAVRDAQSAVKAAADKQCVAAELSLEEADENLSLSDEPWRTAQPAVRTVWLAREFISKACPRARP